jgi:hypothetical protein
MAAAVVENGPDGLDESGIPFFINQQGEWQIKTRADVKAIRSR